MRSVIVTQHRLQKNTRFGRQCGYTLFELLIVLLIITLTLALSGSVYLQSDLSLQGRLFSKKVAYELQAARHAAIAENTYRRWAQSDLNTLLDEKASLHGRISFHFTPNAGAQNERNAFVFYPDGSANGGTIDVVAPKRRWRIHIGLSGRITIDEAHKE